jgi:hypothetical protein
VLGGNNVFIGYLTQPTGIGDFNNSTTLGNRSQVRGSNSTAIGSNCWAMTQDDMILGDNAVNVGIGLSAVGLGPRSKLELNPILGNILTGSFDFTTASTLCIGTGESGLQFRDLTSVSTPCTNPSTSVLTVDAQGRVILVPDGSGGAAPNVNNALNYDPNDPTIIQWGSGTALNTNYTPLLHNTEVQMANLTTPGTGWSVYFTGQSNLTNLNPSPPDPNQMDVCIGYPVNYYDLVNGAKFDVRCVTADNMTRPYNNRMAGKFYETGQFNTGFNTEFVGVAGITDVINTSLADAFCVNIGGDFYGSNANRTNIGARGTVSNEDNGQNSIGLWGRSTNNFAQSFYNVGVKAEALSNIKNSIAVDATASLTPAGGGVNFGVRSTVASILGAQNVGVMSMLGGIPLGGIPCNFGVFSSILDINSWGPPIAPPLVNIGVYSDVNTGYPKPGGQDVGVYGAVLNTPGHPIFGNIAIYGDLGLGAPFPPPCVALPCPPVSWPDIAGYFNGDMVYTTSFYSLSDESVKENIDDIQNPMDIINQLNPKSYTFKHEDNPSIRLATGSHYGLLAQDVQEVLPGLVKDFTHPARLDTAGNEVFAASNLKAVNYSELIPFLIAGIKQQQEQIEEQQEQIEALNAAVFSSENSLQGNGEEQQQQENRSQMNETHIELSTKGAILYQNIPNPFGEETTVKYYLPENSASAKRVFFDEFGSVIQETELSQKGNGSIVINSSNLASGVYSYSLVINGEVKDTKKMIRSK